MLICFYCGVSGSDRNVTVKPAVGNAFVPAKKNLLFSKDGSQISPWEPLSRSLAQEAVIEWYINAERGPRYVERPNSRGGRSRVKRSVVFDNKKFDPVIIENEDIILMPEEVGGNNNNNNNPITEVITDGSSKKRKRESETDKKDEDDNRPDFPLEVLEIISSFLDPVGDVILNASYVGKIHREKILAYTRELGFVQMVNSVACLICDIISGLVPVDCPEENSYVFTISDRGLDVYEAIPVGMNANETPKFTISKKRICSIELFGIASEFRQYSQQMKWMDTLKYSELSLLKQVETLLLKNTESRPNSHGEYTTVFSGVKFTPSVVRGRDSTAHPWKNECLRVTVRPGLIFDNAKLDKDFFQSDWRSKKDHDWDQMGSSIRVWRQLFLFYYNRDALNKEHEILQRNAEKRNKLAQALEESRRAKYTQNKDFNTICLLNLFFFSKFLRPQELRFFDFFSFCVVSNFKTKKNLLFYESVVYSVHKKQARGIYTIPHWK